MEKIEIIGLLGLICSLFALFMIIFLPIFLIPLTGNLEPPYCQYGDINGDGFVTNEDLWTPALTWSQKERADVNNNGVYDTTDRSMITSYINGFLNNFPVGDVSSSAYQPDGKPQIYSFTASKTSIVCGENVTFTAKANDSNGEILTMYVRIFKDGIPVKQFSEVDLEPNTPYIVTYKFEDVGVYEAKAFVTYRYRVSVWYESQPLIINVEPSQSPIPKFDYAVDGLKVTFYDNSYDPDGYIVDWQWNFGDGETGVGQVVNHTYSGSGTYSVTLTVTDNHGNTASTTVDIEVKESNWWWMALVGVGFISIVGIVYVCRKRRRMKK